MQSCCFAYINLYYFFTVLIALTVTVANHKLPIVVIQEFYYHDNMTSHISSLLELC